MTGSIILLHGASSSGKSTLARALQAQLPRPFWHLSLDHLRDSGILPMARFRSGELVWRDAREQIFDGLHATVAAVAQAGNDVIFEHIFETPDWGADLARRFARIDVLFVGVQCDLATLVAREAARGDRVPGSAATDHARVHQGRIYDLEVDGTDDPDATAAAIIARWRAGPRQSELARPAP